LQITGLDKLIRMRAKLLVIMAVFPIIFTVASADDGSSIDVISEEFVNLNGLFYVNISLDPALPLGGAECNILFDPSVVQVENVEDGGMFESWWDANLEIDNVNGTIKNIVAFNFGGNGTSSPGVFAIITFRAESVGMSYINVSGVVLSDETGEPASFTISNSSIIVVNDSKLPLLSYTLAGTAGNNGWYTSNVDITLNATDENGISEMKYKIDQFSSMLSTMQETITQHPST